MGNVQTAQAPKAAAPVASIPFPIASRASTRPSFSVTENLTAGLKPLNPIQIPAVGFIRKLQLKVTVSSTGGTAFQADGPFNLISMLEFRTASGNDIITPVTGYQLYLMNKYGHPTVCSPYSDPKSIGYSTTAGTAATFYLDIPFELDPETGLGSIPALASNRSYQLAITLAPYTAITTATAATVTIEGTAFYWTEPPAQSASGVAQATAPAGLGMVNQWQLENPSLTPGDKKLRLNNVGNILRNQIFVLRNAAGARVDADWPALSEIYLDNEQLFSLPKADWQRWMRQVYGLTAAALDAANGLDTGVFVLPYHAMVGSVAGDPANSRSQYLPTLDASLFEIRGTQFGAASSTLEVLTNSVIPVSTADIFNK